MVFPAPFSPTKRVDLAGRDLQIDVVDGPLGAERPAQAGGVEPTVIGIRDRPCSCAVVGLHGPGLTWSDFGRGR